MSSENLSSVMKVPSSSSRRPTSILSTSVKDKPADKFIPREKKLNLPRLKINMKNAFSGIKRMSVSPTATDAELNTEIEKGKLYLGSRLNAMNRQYRKRFGINVVVSVIRNSLAAHFEEEVYEYRHISIEDSCSANILPFLDSTVNFIEDQITERKRTVLVHCEQGISRSATIVIAYLMKTKTIGLDEAMAEVRKRRACTSPNLAFLGQLQTYEKHLGIQSKLT